MQWVSTKEVRISSNNEYAILCNMTLLRFFWNQPVTVPPRGGGGWTRGGDGHGGGGVVPQSSSAPPPIVSATER